MIYLIQKSMSSNVLSMCLNLKYKQMKTYRDILKWGDKHEEPIDEATLRVIKEEFGLAKIEKSELLGNDEVKLEKKMTLKPNQIKFFTDLCGKKNVETDDFARANHAYGKYYTDLLYLRQGIVSFPPDAVVYPRSHEEVEKIVNFCNEERIALVPFGGNSSVTRGLEVQNGGITLDLTRHLNKIIEIDEINSSVRVQAGILGPVFEKQLNARGYTCGHFPQSFEFSTVGGWAVTKGAGQQSTGYGKMEDMVLSMKMVTPIGTVQTKDFPRSAQGWDLNHTFMGSEGILGVLTDITIKIRKYQPKNTCYASFVFKNFDDAVEGMRTVMQGQHGFPHLFRISDPTETEIAFKTQEFDNSFSDKVLTYLGYKSGERCLMFVNIEGDADFTKFEKSKILKTAKKFRALNIGAKPTRKWLKQRYSSAYMREPLMDLGIMTDTLETAVSWKNLKPLWKSVQEYFKTRKKSVLMVHISHAYENGANLYFIFLSPMKKGDELNDYVEFHRGLVDTISKNGGSLSHHHGVGRVMKPWMPEMHGKIVMEHYKSVKNYFDPNNIMNPTNLI